MPVSVLSFKFIAHASIKNSDVFEVNNLVITGRNDSVFRAGTTLNFEFIVRDKVKILKLILFSLETSEV
jgi:hypothetical protein